MKYNKPIIVISVIIIIGITSYLAAYDKTVRPSRRIAPFVDVNLALNEVPEGTAPASLGNRIPYHAIDAIPSKMESQLSTVTAPYCRSVDTGAALEKVGNFRQITNNYKRGSPDSCSAPNQELVLSFYDVKPVDILAN